MTITEAITAALGGIEPAQVYHPYHGFQERVFCYELYHGLRVLEENGELRIRPARLQAELNKAGRHYFREIIGQLHVARGESLTWKVPEAAPDLLVHEPDPHEHNLLALEAKRWNTPRDDIRWDLAKLALFSAAPLAYRQRVFLVINDTHDTSDEIIRQLKELGGGGEEIDLCLWTPEQIVRWDVLHFRLDEAERMFREEAERRMAEAERKRGQRS